jgi:N-acetylmuramoyl-L-alanine amidase
MKLVISSGHGKHIRGASGYLDEVDEARRVVERVAGLLRNAGEDVTTFHDDVSTSQDENLHRIVDFHNSKTRDLDISVHFNAYETTNKEMGTECLYVTQDELSEQVSEAIATSLELPDRGPKYRGDLYFLNNTEMPAILIETCFVDSSADAEAYASSFDEMCEAIAETLTDGDIGSTDPLPPVPEPEPPPLTEENRVDIIGSVHGDVAVYINGQLASGEEKCANTVRMRITPTGDVVVSINGQDLHRSIPSNQCKITASVFGGESDYNTSAYDPDKVLNDTDLYVALPDRIEGDRPRVKVHNRQTGRSATATIEDVGPWNTDDPYWENGTRPQAEEGTDTQGRETNGAGIDLSPALAQAVGVDGMGTVDWEFVA